ncbi:cell wall hydrolase [Bacillus tianshenii]|nr:cell wall hydrolase [Bacillus tianshenii]
MKKWLKTLTVAALLTGTAYTAMPAEQVQAYTVSAKPLLQQGSQAGYVWDLQHRLNQLGLYNGQMDGIFGPITKQAVLNFQKYNGLGVDGVVGTSTWTALDRVTLEANEIDLLARMVHGEARGESFKGKVAVASVVLNRVASEDFPNTVKGVLYEPYAFTAIADGQFYAANPTPSEYKAVYKAIQGWDPSHGSLFYFNPAKAESDWMYTRQTVTRIGGHIFMK